MQTDNGIFQEVFGVEKYSVRMQETLKSEPELQWLFKQMEDLALQLYDAYDAMFSSDKRMLLYSVGYNAIFAGLAAAASYRNGTICPQDDLFEFLQRSFGLKHLYLSAAKLIWPGEEYNPTEDRFLMSMDDVSRHCLPMVNRLCEEANDEVQSRLYKLEYVQAMILYGGFIYEKSRKS